MSEFLVHECKTDSPATHAIVIGVGDYPHLIDGRSKKTADYQDGMGQITSPPYSARCFANWLIEEHHNLKKPLASVSLLISEARRTPYINTKTKVSYNLRRATIGNATKAILEWRERGDTHEDNQLIFFFCGHGVAEGTAQALLLDDYGKDENNPLKGAIDFFRMRLGLAPCAAREQLFLIDACRASSNKLLEGRGYAGEPIIISPAAPPAARPVLYSTVAGAPAFGRKKSPSYFTEALIQALRGGGADNYLDDDIWSVNTSRLKEVIDVYMNRLHARGSIQKLQTPTADDLYTFPIVDLKGHPATPVSIGCSISDANGKAILHYKDAAGLRTQRPKPSEEQWELIVAGGKKYEFCADFPEKEYVGEPKLQEIRPPLRDVKIPVTRA